jgi:uncharacterized protein (TIGR02246 family)
MDKNELKHLIEEADNAINREDFDALLDFYTDDATLVVKPGMLAKGKDEIRRAFVAIAEYFNHSLVVKQGNMHIIEGGDTALVISKTLLSANQKTDSAFSMERNATYVFRKDADGMWRCVIDNSYGIELLELYE